MFPFIPYKMRLLRMISRRIENYRKKTINGLELLSESVFKGGMFGLIIATILWISIFSYVLFYFLYMPSLSHTRPVHLQFTACEDEKGVCSFPSAHVQLTKKQQLLMIGQRYKIFLSLDMPESPANVDLGMFMVCARMVDRDGILVSSACRSTMLHYRSYLVKFLSTFVYSPFFIFGSREEKQMVQVELYSDYEEHQGHPVTDIYVEVQTRFVELYTASLHIQAHLSGVRYLMFNWPILSAVLGIGSNLFVIIFITSLSWYHLYVHQEYGKNYFMYLLKKSMATKTLRRRHKVNQDYIEELDQDSEKQTESSSENDEAKSEFFKAGTTRDLGFFFGADD